MIYDCYMTSLLVKGLIYQLLSHIQSPN